MSIEGIRESLSALLDDETTELEVRRLLRDLTEEDAQQFSRWQVARDVLQGHDVATVRPEFNARLSAALTDQAAVRPAWMNPVAKLAVAASVAAATVVGWQYWEAGAPQAAPMTAAAETRLPRLLGSDVEVLVPAMPAQASTASLQTPEQEQRLDSMRVRHGDFAAQHSGQGVMASARVVSQEAGKDEE